jgi:NAD(P)-dependent dehydrogenase (short-subunit alcohol dehydrogenase family)
LATTALGRIGQPEEVARGILWMLSDESSFMTASVRYLFSFLDFANAFRL